MLVADDKCALCELARRVDPASAEMQSPKAVIAAALVMGAAIATSDEAEMGFCASCQVVMQQTVEAHNRTVEATEGAN